MSAIAGVVYLDGRPVNGEPERMAERLAHRGPDGSGAWTRGSVGLGHRLRHTTPESLSEQQPVVVRSGDLALVADARIDNRAELLAALDAEPRSAEISDAELILRAYEAWGEKCPERLLGDFAFAIWDERRQVLFCARDHFGAAPFYYHHAPDRAFIFASEIKALFCCPEVPRRLNEERLSDYLQPMLEDKTCTFHRDIHRLAPAHRAVVSRDGIRIEEYWALDPEREIRCASDAEYAEGFRERFLEAVRCRTRSAFPVGSLLSGGLDSSSIACAARMPGVGNGEPVHTFSAVFDEVRQCDERPYIEAALAGGGMVPHYVQADRVSPMVELDRVFEHEDEPFYAPNLFMHWALFGAAREQGVRVLLDGLDGDSTVSHGNAYLTELARSGRWIELAREARQIGRKFEYPTWRIVWDRGMLPLVPAPLRRVGRRLQRHPAATVDPILNPSFARRIDVEGRMRAGFGMRMVRPARTAREEHYWKMTSGLLPFFLEVANKAARSFGIEPRYPFFDPRLVEYCLALPGSQKVHDGWTRVVMRRGLAGILPPEIQWRGGKSDLSHNFNRGLLSFERPRLEEVILKDPSPIEPYVNLSFLREAYARYLGGATSHEALAVWKAVTLALWLRRAEFSA